MATLAALKLDPHIKHSTTDRAQRPPHGSPMPAANRAAARANHLELRPVAPGGTVQR